MKELQKEREKYLKRKKKHNIKRKRNVGKEPINKKRGRKMKWKRE